MIISYLVLDPDAGVVLSALMRPSRVTVAHVVAHALHLREPSVYAQPPPFDIPPPELNNHR